MVDVRLVTRRDVAATGLSEVVGAAWQALTVTGSCWVLSPGHSCFLTSCVTLSAALSVTTSSMASVAIARAHAFRAAFFHAASGMRVLRSSLVCLLAVKQELPQVMRPAVSVRSPLFPVWSFKRGTLSTYPSQLLSTCRRKLRAALVFVQHLEGALSRVDSGKTIAPAGWAQLGDSKLLCSAVQCSAVQCKKPEA